MLVVLLPLAATAAAARPSQLSSNARASIDDDDLGWGEQTVVRGSGFLAGEIVRVILYAGGTELAAVPADGNGDFAAVITIPSGVGSSDQYRLAVQGPAADGAFGYIALPLTIRGPTPVLSIADSELEWEAVTTIRGERYQPGAVITISLFPNNTPLGETAAGSDGTFQADIRIPTDLFSSPDYQIAVTGQGIDLLFHFDTIPVTIIGDRPIIKVDRTDVPRGGSVRVQGELFLKDTTATITLLPGFEKLGEVAVDAGGRFDTDVTIPEDAFAPDPHQLVVTGQGADGLFTYDTAPLSIDGPTTPSGPGGTVSTLPPGDGDARPEFDRFVDRLLGTVPAPERGSGSSLGLVVLLLTLLLLLVLILTARRRRT